MVLSSKREALQTQATNGTIWNTARVFRPNTQLKGMWTQDSFPINSILKIYLSCIKSLSSPWGKFLGRVFFSLELLITVMAARSMKMFEVYFYWYLKISRGLYCKQGCINKYMCIFAIVVPDYLFSTALFTLPQLFSLETFQWCTISLLPLWK